MKAAKITPTDPRKWKPAIAPDPIPYPPLSADVPYHNARGINPGRRRLGEQARGDERDIDTDGYYQNALRALEEHE